MSREDLEGHGRANLLGDRRRLPRRLRDPRRDGGHPVGSEECLGFGLGEPSTPFAERPRDEDTGSFGVGREFLGDGGRGLHQQLLRAPVIDQVHEGAHGLAGRRIARDPMRPEHPPRLLGRAITHPARDERRVPPLTPRLDQRLCGFGAGGHGGRAMECQHGIHAGVFHQGRERLRIAAPGGITDDIHRVMMGPGGRQRHVQPVQRLRRELRQDPALIDQVIGREHREAAAVAQDGHARPLRSRGHR